MVTREDRGLVGVMLPRDLPVGSVAAFARRAEELGFDELWVVEDLGFRGGIAQAATVLALTSHITVGIGILPAGARNAAFAAMELATLEQLHPGRVVVGIGHGMPGWMRQAGAWPSSPLTLLREYTRALTELLSGRPGPAGGRYVDVGGIVLDELPSAPPPLLLGVRGPRSLALAGEVADGVVLAEPAHPSYVAEALRSVTAGSGALAPAGTAAPRVVAYDVASVSSDREAALAAARPALAWLGEPDWAPHIAPLPFAAEFTALRETASDPEHFATLLPDEWVASLAIAGTPADARSAIAARHAAGTTTVVLTPVGSDRLRVLDSLAGALTA
ncbi:LLM class flavin-dependent oxidoreductase [Herbiconiux moechotypicola]|uniref:LLM class flavin-dependent oxidoreductase n=1 Tax=Herbiconiux moechotypicola TaxID=637393 RepID=A0ABN3DAL4_9MICO|nr:LLM class flavin-dependent oxidoreductase [Herbiconiux moechotypicola]MCS5728957.1 LLM class flavin-dependent oxidoreductase [Herbiconiux moechotypicola]